MLSMHIHSAQNRYQDSLRRKDASFRSLRDGDMDRLKAHYNDLNDAYQNQAWGYAFNILGSVCKILSAAFDPNDTTGRVLSSVSSTLEGTAGFKIKLDEGDITFIQGLLEQTRNSMQNTEKENDELRQMLRQIEQMLDEAKARAERNISTPFTANAG